MSIGFINVTPSNFQYVGVRLMFHPDGKEVPEVIFWPDGREFIVDECIGKFTVPNHINQHQYFAYWVYIHGKARVLYWDLTDGRWFVDPLQREGVS